MMDQRFPGGLSALSHLVGCGAPLNSSVYLLDAGCLLEILGVCIGSHP